jgi:hypothetical protein
MQKNTQKHYKLNKKTYYLNLRSNDAQITPSVNGGNNLKFEWNINKNIGVSRQARMCLTSFFFQDAGGGGGILELPVVIRCPQVQGINSFDSANGQSTIIHVSNMLHSPSIENWYPLNNQSLDRIELYMSNVVDAINHGIPDTMEFYVQLKIEDYDTEEVDPILMPTYTRDNLTFQYPLNV